jgi:RNA polymerase sigma-70 factor (ECF subfamily)
MSWLWPNATTVSDVEWDAVYERELPRIYNFFRYRIGDDTLAEDLTSATFEKAWRGRDSYRRDTAKFSTWLYAIARNVAIDHFRRSGRELPLEAAADVPSGTTPEDDVVHAGDLERLAVLLNGLGERERELLAFKYGAELTNREIARVTKLSESNVGTILHRAVATLRSRW